LRPNELMTLGILIGGLTLVALVSCIGGFLHYRRERMLMHAERMKALELGRDLPDDPETAKIKAAAQARAARQSGLGETTLAARCFSTTGYVCGTGFVFAFLSNTTSALAIASATGAIGVTGIICGTILASKAATEPEPRSGGMVARAKPFFDPETV
jgi:hypothetical protein